jgi:hypothetical protein
MSFPVAHLLDCNQQFFLNGFVVRELILGYVNYHNTDAKPGDMNRSGLVFGKQPLNPGILRTRQQGCAFHNLIVSKVKDGEHLLPGDGWIELEELVDGLATLQKINQTLNGNPSTTEAGRTAHSLGVNPDHFVEPALLFRSHKFNIRAGCRLAQSGYQVTRKLSATVAGICRSFGSGRFGH